MLLQIGRIVINTDRVENWVLNDGEVMAVFGLDSTIRFRKPEEIQALTAWLDERSVDLLKAQAVAA